MGLSGLQLESGAYALGIFDLDGNLLEMPTKHYYQHKTSKDVVAILGHEVDQDPDKYLGPNAEYQYVDGDKSISYRNYQDTCFHTEYEHRGPEGFLEDVREALNTQTQLTPPMQVMKDTFLIPGRMMSINTARGHSPETLMRGLRIINNWILTSHQQQEQLENIRRNYFATYKGKEPISDEELLEYYLKRVVNYIPGDNADVQKHMGLDAPTRDLRKVQGLEWNLDYVRRQLAEIMKKPIAEVLTQETPLAVGFSDDGAKNIETIGKHLVDIHTRETMRHHTHRLFYTGPYKHIDRVLEHIGEGASYISYPDSGQVGSTKLRISLQGSER